MTLVDKNIEVLEHNGFEYDGYWEGFLLHEKDFVMMVKIEDDKELQIFEAETIMSEFNYMDSVTSAQEVLEWL